MPPYTLEELTYLYKKEQATKERLLKFVVSKGLYHEYAGFPPQKKRIAELATFVARVLAVFLVVLLLRFF